MRREVILIVGGGFTGAVAAAALVDGDRQIVVLEARNGSASKFSGELIHPPGVDILQQLNLLPALQKAGSLPVSGFVVSCARHGRSAVLPYAEISGGRGEGAVMNCHRLLEVLQDESRRRPGVEWLENQRVVDVIYNQGRVIGVKTEGGKEFRADVTLVAQGRQAPLRRILGLGEKSMLLSFSAALLLRKVELPERGYAHIFLGGPGPMIAHAVSPNEVRLCIDLPGELKNKAAIANRLTGDYGNFLPAELLEALRQSDEEPAICPNYAIYTGACVAPGAALIGDAAGCTHPLTGTGMTTCLNDVRILSEEFRREGIGDPSLYRYQRRRYRFVRTREIMADALYEVFRGEEAGNRALREALFRCWTKSEGSRARSLALLSGHESATRALGAEYARVLAESLLSLLKGDSTQNTFGERARAVTHLVKSSSGKCQQLIVGLLGGVPKSPQVKP